MDRRARATRTARPEAPDETAEPPRPRDVYAPRAALGLFVALEAVALPLQLWWGRGAWFAADDWDFLSQRTGGNLRDLFRPHLEHWVTLPILVYRLVWSLVGLRSYVPYQLLVILLHLIAAALLRVVMRRSGVAPWMSTLAAALLVFLGSGAENILVAFQITFVAALVFGLTQLLLADHDGRVDRRDWLGLGAGLAGLMCSGVAIPMTLVVGLATLARRGSRIAALHTAPLAVVYVIWAAAAPKGQSVRQGHAQSASGVLRFVVIGLEGAFGRLGQLPGIGVLLAVVLFAGLAVTFLTRGGDALRGRAATPVALLAGALLFLVITAAGRSGQFGAFRALTGPEHARSSRYIYLVVAMALPAVAMAADALIRHWHRLALPVCALLVVGLPGNIHQFTTFTNRPALASNREEILIAARLPLAHQLPRSLPTGGGFYLGPTLGWLMDSLRSGSIPLPAALTPDDLATETLKLALQPTRRVADSPCQRLTRPTIRVLREGFTLTLKVGTINVTYLPPSGGRSAPRPLRQGSFVALVGPLRLLLGPTRTLPTQQAFICI